MIFHYFIYVHRNILIYYKRPQSSDDLSCLSIQSPSISNKPLSRLLHVIHISPIFRISISKKRFLPSLLMLIDGRLSVLHGFPTKIFRGCVARLAHREGWSLNVLRFSTDSGMPGRHEIFMAGARRGVQARWKE